MDLFLTAFLSILLVAAAIIDIRTQKIPNALTYPAMALAFTYLTVTRGSDGALFSAKGLALGIGLFIYLYAKGGMGAGDVKLMGAVGATLGARGVFISALLTAIVGGVYALIVLLLDLRHSKEFFTRYATVFKSFVLTRQLDLIPAEKTENEPKLHYGLAIALGTLLFIWLELSGVAFL